MKRVIFAGCVALPLLILGALGVWFYLQTRPLSNAFQPQLVRLREPIDADALAERLAARNLVRNPRLLAWCGCAGTANAP